MYAHDCTYPECHNCCRNMKEEDVDNDHVKDPFDALLIVDDKVKSGI